MYAYKQYIFNPFKINKMGKPPISIINGLGYRSKEQGTIPIKTFRFNRIDINAPFVGIPWEHPFRMGQEDPAGFPYI